MSMTRAERDDLLRLVRSRERVLKSAAQQRAAEMEVEFEHQLDATYWFDQDAVWKQAAEAAQAAVDDASKTIAQRCEELGIPAQFAPHVDFHWYGRGENASKERRAELRRIAKAEIDAISKAARVKIERISLQAQTEILANGLTTEAAKAFLQQMQSVDELMPTLQLPAIEAKATAKRIGYSR